MEIIDQIRQTANIIEIASQYTTLRQRGRKYVGLCPFHSEKSPSFTVDPEKGLFHCFGCGVGGDIFSLVMEKENISFPEALKFLADKYHIPLPEQRKLSPQALKLEEQLLKINEAALAFFKKNLLNTQEGKKALEYLRKRNISDKTIQDFKLGYAPNVWNSLGSYFKNKGIELRLLEKAGLVLPGRKAAEPYDRFRGRIIFPIFSLTGKVVGFGGRTLFGAEPKYLNSPDTPVYSKGQLLYGLNFTKDAVRAAGELILVEGYTDFLALYQSGITACAASLGTALTTHQVNIASRFAPRVIINYDGDAAGLAAALRAIPLCFEKGLETRVLVLPEKLDPDGFIRSHGPDEYMTLVRSAVPAFRFLVDSSVEGKRLNVPEEKTKVLRGIVAVIDNIPDSVVRSEYLKQTAEYLGVEEFVLRDIAQHKKGEEPAEETDFFFPAEKRLLQILIENKELRPYVFAEMRDDDFEGLKSQLIFKIISDYFKKDKDFIFHDLQKDIGPSLTAHLSQALQEKGPPPTVEEALDCISALQRTSLENQMKRVQAEITRLEKNGEREKLRALLFRKQDLIKQILGSK
jgi:DNA primase